MHTHYTNKQQIQRVVADSIKRYGNAIVNTDNANNTHIIAKNNGIDDDRGNVIPFKTGVAPVQTSGVAQVPAGMTNYDKVVNAYKTMISKGIKPSVQAISNELRMNAGTVSKQLQRAREKGKLNNGIASIEL